jgi:xylulokinase
MIERVLIGVDLGTTRTKGAVFDLDGALLARRECAGGVTLRPRASWAEQDAEGYLAKVESVVRELLEDVDRERVAGVGICSQVNTHVFTGPDGLAVAPAIAWQDQRCAAIAAELTDRTGTFVDPSSLLARAGWMRRVEKEIWERTRWILSPKDYVNLRVTGSAASDALSSIGLVEEDGTAYRDLDGFVEGVESRLPPLDDPGRPVGTTRDGALGLRDGVPVAVA